MAIASDDPLAARARREPAKAPLPIAALVATAWADLLSFAPVLLTVAIAGALSLDGLRLAGAIWLLGQGVAIELPGDRVSLMPLALTLLAVWRLARAGVHVSRTVGGHRSRSIWRCLGAAVTVGAVHAVFGGATAMLVTDPDVRASVTGSVVAFGLVGTLAAFLGAVLHGRAGRALIRRVPLPLAHALRGGLLAAALMLATGSATAGAALALAGGDAAGVLGGFHAGVAGQVGITLASLAYVPNAAIWATSYLIGPGFALGSGTVVSQSSVLLGPVPAVPLLAGVPDAPIGAAGPALLALPLIAALVAGWQLTRRYAGAGWRGLLGSAALASPIAGAAIGLAARASSGSLGSGRLLELGPAAWPVAGWATALALLGLLAGAASARAFLDRRAS